MSEIKKEELKLIGYFSPVNPEDKPDLVYFGNNKRYIDWKSSEKIEEDTDEYVKQSIEEPWSYATCGYHIHKKDGHDKTYEEVPWTCEYYSIVYDNIQINIIGEGKTVQEALDNCRVNIKLITTDFE